MLSPSLQKMIEPRPIILGVKNGEISIQESAKSRLKAGQTLLRRTRQAGHSLASVVVGIAGFLTLGSVTPVLAFDDAAPPISVVDVAQKQVVEFVGKLADLHCTEDVVQEKLRPNGNSEATARSQFDYFLYIQGNSYDFQLSESRLEIGSPKQKKEPLLLTNGFSTLLLVFHPYYRNGFEFTVGPRESLDARPVIPIHYVHIAGARTPMAMAMRGREFPLEMKGTAWVDASTGQVLRMDASLSKDLSDVGLRALNVRVDYTPSLRVTDKFMLPSRAVVDLETPRQHWRNTHVFHNYKLFSTDATQDPAVKVHGKDGDPDPNAAPSATSPNMKEQF